MRDDSFIEFVTKHRWRILLVAIAVIALILLFTIGFWKTLLVVGIVALCYFIGRMLDNEGKDGFAAFFKALFGQKDE
ncbi:MAG: DUF2273 domain-containing protein [Clostridia bacterium]|nr:DUF2273 domain-containing protein [Clostridia bacterium]